MPNDVYQWEAAGGLVHHCPICFKPLTTPQARSRCLGEHVEWCKQYHTQLFKKGTSGQCEPCRRSDEEHTKRHREIAEKIHELKLSKAEQTPLSPLTPKVFNAMTESPSLLSKKERKAAKKAKKVSEMVKVVSSADVDFVSKVLHPMAAEEDEVEVERQLLEDPDIKLNRFFHKGTGQHREIRNEFIKKDRRGSSKSGASIAPKEIDGLLQLLNISPLTPTSTTDEKSLHSDLRKKIQDDLTHVRKEEELLMMRKAGFWRWASKKAYKRLVQHGKIWSDKENKDGSDGSTHKTDDTTDSSSAAAGAEDDSTELDDTDVTTPSEEDEEDNGDGSGGGIGSSMSALKFKSAPAASVKTPRNSPSKDLLDGWTSVGNKTSSKTHLKKTKSPIGNLKLSHNSGLAKLQHTPDPQRRKFYNNELGEDVEI